MKKEEKAHFGQSIRTESSPDRSSHKVKNDEALCGRSMPGGPTDVSHSLSGAGSVETYNDAGKKSRKS